MLELESTFDEGTEIAALLLDELFAAVEHGEFGVLVTDVKPINYSTLISNFSARKASPKKRLRLCVIGADNEIAAQIVSTPSIRDFISPFEETAVAWRNQFARTIAVVTDRPLSRAASLHEFRSIGEVDLIRRLCEQQRDAAEVTWLRTLWDTLKRSLSLRISLAQLVAFSHRLEGLPISQRSLIAPRSLHLLGLFPDSHLADESSEKALFRRLESNRNLVNSVRRATEDDWARVRQYCRSLNGLDKTSANRGQRELKGISAGIILDHLDLLDAQRLWRGKVSSLGNAAANVRTNHIHVDQAVGAKLLAGDSQGLGDVAAEIQHVVEACLEDDSAGESQLVRSASTADLSVEIDVNRELLELIRSRSTSDEWGGVIEVAPDKPSTLTDVAAFQSWSGFLIKPISEQLRKFVDEDLAPNTLLELLQRLAILRSKLLPYACELAIAPIATLAGITELFDVAEQYLTTYDALLQQLKVHYSPMHAAADLEAEAILGSILSLELYVYRRETSLEAVMSPLHPLFLWRSLEIVREIRGLGSALSEKEITTLEDACAQEVHLLQVLVLPPQATFSERSVTLGQAGELGRLPIFREAPRGLLDVDGLKTVIDLAQRLSKMRPFARPCLQVLLINPPHPNRFIDGLVAALDFDDLELSESYVGLNIRIVYTDLDTVGWASEVSSMSDELREKLSAGEERGRITLSVDQKIRTWDETLVDLEKRPAHFTVIFDPFEVRATSIGKAGPHSLNPWMPTREYRYNKIRHEIVSIEVAEEHVFGSYLSAAALMNPALQHKTLAHLPSVMKVRTYLDAVAAISTWTVVADPHGVPIARLGEAEVIDRRIDHGRLVTTFGADLAPFVRRLREQLRRTHFSADQETLRRLVRDLVALEPNGILSVATTAHEKQVKGSLGKLIAAQWYQIQQPSGLSVSLDTEDARQWLVAGHHSLEKADLLGLREVEGAIVIDVIEVKAHDEALPYSIVGELVTGHAVEQIHATLHALAEIFSGDSKSPLVKPRREVLREHLYTALSRTKNDEQLERWHGLLDDMFLGRIPVLLEGRLIHVQFASIAQRELRTLRSAKGLPIRLETLSAADVGLVLEPHDRRSIESHVTAPTTSSATVEVALPAIAASEALSLLVATVTDSTSIDMQLEGFERKEDAEHQEVQADTVGKEPLVVIERAEKSSPNTLLSVELGSEHSSSTKVIWQPGRQSNGFLLVLGASGSGKTEALKVLGASIADYGVPVLVFDFHGDVTFPGLLNVLLSSGQSSTLGLNPMELDVNGARESGLYDQRAALRGLVMRAVPALGHRQAAILREAFDEAYTRAGVIDSEPTTWNNEPPTFRNVEEILDRWSDDDDRKNQRGAIEGCLAAIQELFGHPIFQRDRQVSIDEMLVRSVRLDLSKLPDQVRFVATETLLRRIFRVLRMKGPIPVTPTDDLERFRLFIVIDEAKILSLGGGERDRADNVLNELITESRKFGLGMILASQMSDHFSEEVRSNAATWLVLKPMDVREAKRNAPNVSVDTDDLIRLVGRGDGYYRDRPSSRARRVQIRPLSDR